MFIDESQRVGIGTTVPTQRLDVVGAGLFRSGNTALSTTNNQILFGFNGTDSFKHAIKTRHNDLGKAGNAIDFYTWDQGVDATTAVGTKQVMTLDGNGNVGIGITAPTVKLHVVGGNITSTCAAGTNVFQTSATRAIWMTSNNNSADKVLGINMQNNIINSKYIGFENAGGGDIGGITMATTTSIAFNTTSDERLKENIRNTSMGINDLMKIKVADYVYKSDKNLPQTGFIAQQLHTVFPNAVTVGGEDVTKNPWAVDYGKVTPLIVKATQDLKNEVESLKKEIETLKALIQKSK
jgi:hypothetical protein